MHQNQFGFIFYTLYYSLYNVRIVSADIIIIIIIIIIITITIDTHESI
jgi:hypothetical protein